MAGDGLGGRDFVCAFCSSDFVTLTFCSRSDSPFSARNFHVEEFLTKMAARPARDARNPVEFRETAKITQSVPRLFLAR